MQDPGNTVRRTPEREYFTVPEISRFLGIIIAMYYNDQTKALATHRAIGVKTMVPRVTEVEVRDGYTVWLEFSDGASGEIDLEPELWGEVFEPLRDLKEFRKARLDEELGTIVWPNGADFAPEFLYQQLRPNYSLRPTPHRGAA